MEVQAKDYSTEIANLINILRSVKENLKMMKGETEDKKIELLAITNRIYEVKIHQKGLRTD